MNRYWVGDECYWERVRQAMQWGRRCDAEFRTACAIAGLDWQKAITAPIHVLAERQVT